MGFISDEFEYQIKMVEKHRKSQHSKAYETIQSMLEFEIANDSTRAVKSGSRGLLRLHRALACGISFVDQLLKSKDTDEASHMAKEAYSKTLAKYHLRSVQKLAVLVMKMFPSRRRMIREFNNPERAPELLSDLVREAQAVYDITQELFERHKLLDIFTAQKLLNSLVLDEKV